MFPITTDIVLLGFRIRIAIIEPKSVIRISFISLRIENKRGMRHNDMEENELLAGNIRNLCQILKVVFYPRLVRCISEKRNPVI